MSSPLASLSFPAASLVRIVTLVSPPDRLERLTRAITAPKHFFRTIHLMAPLLDILPFWAGRTLLVVTQEHEITRCSDLMRHTERQAPLGNRLHTYGEACDAEYLPRLLLVLISCIKRYSTKLYGHDCGNAYERKSSASSLTYKTPCPA